MNKLEEKYKKEVIPGMMKKFGYKNRLAVPRVLKVVVNTGFGKTISGKTSDETKKTINGISEDLGLITGQKPLLTKSRKSIAGFKLRENIVIGAKVTLRGKRMYDFMERIIDMTLPRSRDFRGIDTASFDKKGNLNLAVKEHIAFPEISPERSKIIFGLELTVVTNAGTNKEGVELLRALGFPIKI